MTAGSIDEYLAGLSEDKKCALEALRRTIQAAAPEAEEGYSYGLPAFRIDGRPLVAFGAAADHCAFYPMSPALQDAHAEELSAFDTDAGTVRFQPDRPLPPDLVRTLVRARLAELEARKKN